MAQTVEGADKIWFSKLHCFLFLSFWILYISKASTSESLSSTFLWGHEDYRRVKMLLTFTGECKRKEITPSPSPRCPRLHLKYLKVCFTGKSERRPTKRHCWRGVFGSGAPTVSLSVHLTELPTVLFCIQLLCNEQDLPSFLPLLPCLYLYPAACSLPLPLSCCLLSTCSSSA